MRMPDVAEEEVVVERATEYRGWRIRTKDQHPGTGTVVTDNWLTTFGFSRPTKFNINKIIDAMVAAAGGYAPVKVDLDLSAKRYGDPFSEKGSAVDIEIGEGGRYK